VKITETFGKRKLKFLIYIYLNSISMLLQTRYLNLRRMPKIYIKFYFGAVKSADSSMMFSLKKYCSMFPLDGLPEYMPNF
jgi:hypothetical protein